MHDYYAERLHPWYRRQSEIQTMEYPYYDDYDERVLGSMQQQLVKAFRPCKYDSDSDSEEGDGLEKVKKAQIQTTLEYEKAKEVSDDAMKKLMECEAKMHAANKEFEKAKRSRRRRCIDY